MNPPDEVISRYEVVPYVEKESNPDLYSFRTAMPAPVPPLQPPTPAQRAATSRKNIAVMTGIGAVALLLAVLIVMLIENRRETGPPFIDLGEKNDAAAGLGGRLIVKWDGRAEYELHVDPLVAGQIPAFSAVAAVPPRPISFDLHLKDAAGAVLCQKEILLPVDTGAQTDPANAQPQIPTQTIGGDVVQNVAEGDGKIDEVVVNGQLPCSAKAYKRLTAWDFASSFPTVAAQQEWMSHEESVEGNLRRRAADARAKALIPRVLPLAAPIEGDDVIVFDNPTKGTVETKAGRLFFLGRNGLRQHAPGWQVFPAVIHFRCDVKSNCVLTRADASAAVQARLVR
jgi:hypothetical protein